ncbi:hypothetical protein PMZ80_008489 [Knufia obscura]|uniref:Uncharacterized protein n=2 Tax=Knufia TaxID=430999 RepID=A0AAN8EL16_9EURO|nr:hypothetical protein PMZ80_008489 [Knufia obscura]KAK5951945.1 hypothetical protein OHC33_006831 [Knufia fluminis]
MPVPAQRKWPSPYRSRFTELFDAEPLTVDSADYARFFGADENMHPPPASTSERSGERAELTSKTRKKVFDADSQAIERNMHEDMSVGAHQPSSTLSTTAEASRPPGRF